MDLKLELPTPIHKLNESLNDNVFYIKREDLMHLSFGGNKLRKAILFFEDIVKKGADCVVTYGSKSSNHARIIANLSFANRLPCYIITPLNRNDTYNSVMVNLFNADIIYSQITEVKDTINDLLMQLKKDGFHPYFIQGGGHGDLGTQAYVNAYNEICNYEKTSAIFFDYIFFASGTGTTQAGLICGSIINTDQRNIIGISVARKNPDGKKIIVDSVNSFLNKYYMKNNYQVNATFVDDYILDGYGSYNKEILITVKDVLMNEGVPLDSTYTGKAYWGMKEYIKTNNIYNKNILFLHTGGLPLFFHDLIRLKNLENSYG